MSERPFGIGPEIRTAATLPARVYSDPAFRGVRSRLYDRGRDSPTREAGVHHFHRLLAEFMHA